MQLPPLPASALAFQEDRAINMNAVKRINDAAPTGWRTGAISRIVPGQRATGQGVGIARRGAGRGRVSIP
jgi:hypothetical protein